MHIRFHTFIFIFILLQFLTGCGGNGSHWYKAGHYQADFNRNSQECEMVAQEIGRQATMTGLMVDADTYQSAYTSCIVSKGWSTTPPTQPQATPQQQQQTAPTLAERRSDGTIRGFDLAFTVPLSFTVIGNRREGLGANSAQIITLHGPDNTYLNLMFQQIKSNRFIATDYPIKEPFFLYNNEYDQELPDQLRWATFCGTMQGQWVIGLGAYYLVDKEHRVTMAFTSPLPPQEEAPPKGLRLSANQRLAADRFEKKWLGWLQKTTSRQEGLMHRFWKVTPYLIGSHSQ